MFFKPKPRAPIQKIMLSKSFAHNSDRIFFKDNLRNLHPGRWRRLNQQVGYKIQALLQLRSQFANEITQVLWGDDSETDATKELD